MKDVVSLKVRRGHQSAGCQKRLDDLQARVAVGARSQERSLLVRPERRLQEVTSVAKLALCRSLLRVQLGEQLGQLLRVIPGAPRRVRKDALGNGRLVAHAAPCAIDAALRYRRRPDEHVADH